MWQAGRSTSAQLSGGLSRHHGSDLFMAR